VSMCDGTDDPNQTGTTPNRTNWDNPSRTGTTQPSGTTQPNWDSPAKWDSPGRAGTTQPAGPSQSELRHSKDRLSQSGPGRPSPLGRPTQTWSGPIFSRLLRSKSVVCSFAARRPRLRRSACNGCTFTPPYSHRLRPQLRRSACAARRSFCARAAIRRRPSLGVRR
jgi:hypothetical protein